MKKDFSVLAFFFLLMFSGCIFSGDSDRNSEYTGLLMKFDLSGGIAGDHIVYNVYSKGYITKYNMRVNNTDTTSVMENQLKEVNSLLDNLQFYRLKAEYKVVHPIMDGFKCTFEYYGSLGNKQIKYADGSDIPVYMKTTMSKVCSILDIPPYCLSSWGD